MKKLILTMLAGMMVLGAMAQGGKFTVKGTFDWKKDTVNFIIVKNDRPIMNKKRAITGKMLEATFNLRAPEMLYVVFSENGNKTRLGKTPAIPGETVEFYRDGASVTQMRGSQFYVDYNEAEKSIEAPLMELTNFEGECTHKIAMGTPILEVQKEYDEKFPAYYNAYMDALTAYVKAHPDQEASAALIATIGETSTDSLIEDIESTAALLTERVQLSNAAGLYKKILESAKKKREKEERINALIGNMAPDFTLMDINGNPLALSSLRGKWVVVDFWGSWCGWCIKGMPDMKEYYAKYQDKLEILGVDCNDTVEKWKDAVAKHELPWLHVYCDNDKGDNPVKLYLVEGFPTKVVIDPEGKVAKIIRGEDPAFYEYLDEVLQ